MRKVIVEPHYLGSLEYFIGLLDCDEVMFEIHQHFTKQTYKNRSYLLTANGVRALSVPVSYSNRTALKEVKIDYRQSWMRDHWGALYSAYGKAPFFEFFADYFHRIWEKKQSFLLDLNMEMMTMCLKILQIDIKINFTDTYKKEPETSFIDLREYFLPKVPYKERGIYRPYNYPQAFGNEFVPNLSLVDLLMNEGTHALNVLVQSQNNLGEQIGS